MRRKVFLTATAATIFTVFSGCGTSSAEIGSKAASVEHFAGTARLSAARNATGLGSIVGTIQYALNTENSIFTDSSVVINSGDSCPIDNVNVSEISAGGNQYFKYNFTADIVDPSCIPDHLEVDIVNSVEFQGDRERYSSSEHFIIPVKKTERSFTPYHHVIKISDNLYKLDYDILGSGLGSLSLRADMKAKIDILDSDSSIFLSKSASTENIDNLSSSLIAEGGENIYIVVDPDTAVDSQINIRILYSIYTDGQIKNVTDIFSVPVKYQPKAKTVNSLPQITYNGLTIENGVIVRHFSYDSSRISEDETVKIVSLAPLTTSFDLSDYPRAYVHENSHVAISTKARGQVIGETFRPNSLFDEQLSDSIMGRDSYLLTTNYTPNLYRIYDITEDSRYYIGENKLDSSRLYSYLVGSSDDTYVSNITGSSFDIIQPFNYAGKDLYAVISTSDHRASYLKVTANDIPLKPVMFTLDKNISYAYINIPVLIGSETLTLPIETDDKQKNQFDNDTATLGYTGHLNVTCVSSHLNIKSIDFKRDASNKIFSRNGVLEGSRFYFYPVPQIDSNVTVKCYFYPEREFFFD